MKKLSKADLLWLASLVFVCVSLCADLWWYPHLDWSTWCAWAAWALLSLSYRAYINEKRRQRDPVLALTEPKNKGVVV